MRHGAPTIEAPLQESRLSSNATALRGRAGRHRAETKYRLPPGLERNLAWYAFRKFKPQDPIQLFQHLVRTYGNIAHYKVGPAHIVFVNEPEYIYEVFVAQQEKFIKERTQQRSKMLLGEGMITSEGAQHRRQRTAALPAFHKQRIAGYASTVVEKAAALREQWQNGETRDISQEMMHLTLDIVARTLFGKELGRDIFTVTEAINEIMRLYNYLVALPGVETLVHMPIPGLRKFRPARERLDDVVYRMIEDRRSDPADRDDLLSMMLEADPTVEHESLRDQVLTIFLAGYETVANAMAWTWYLLSQNAHAERKFHLELDEILSGRLPAFEDVPKLQYTEMIFAEAMRLFPPAWAMGRVSTDEFTLGHYCLPRKTTVLASQFLLHRDARFFEVPLEFRPERFAPDRRAEIPKFAYLPFGIGLRRCIGESFAWMEGVLLLATIGQRWKLHLAPGQRVEVAPLITLRAKYGMKMQSHSRIR